MRRLARAVSAAYLRNFIFGVEDSLVSTVGLLSGVAIAAVPRATIVLTGVVLIFVEAFSMGVGSFLSEQSAEGFGRRGEPPLRLSVQAGAIMFSSYLVAGFVPLAPYVLASAETAFPVSILLSLAALFALGIVGARLSGRRVFANAVRMLLLGGIAIAIGVVVGRLVQA